MPGFSSVSDLLKRATDAGDVPGVAVSVATPDGVAFEGAFGKRDLASGAAMTIYTVVRIASMTKAITGACAMQLVEQGKLKLDEPIGPLLPELGAVKVLEGYDSDGKPRLREPKRPITLRHLLTHTSGHTYDIWNATIGEYRTKSDTPLLGSGLLSSLSIPLLFDPGEKWEYSISIDWAGRAVEEVSGLKLADYMKRNMFDPLGMPDTGFRIGDSQRAAARIALPAQAGRADAVHARAAGQSGIRRRRRRAFLDGAGLHEVRADDAAQGHVQRRAGAEARDRRTDVAERHGRRERAAAAGHRADADQQRRLHRRHEVGPHLPDQPAAAGDADARPARSPGRG